MPKRSETLSRWEAWAVRWLKILILAFLSAATLLFFWLCVRAAFLNGYRLDLGGRVFSGVVWFFIGVCSLLFT